MNLSKNQWYIIREVLYDYLDNYDEGAYGKDIEEILIKMNEQL